MPLNKGDRVEHVDSEIKGTVESDDGVHVLVKWDDGQTGILEYNRTVCFNAYKLQRLVKT